MVIVDMQIALGADMQVNARMLRKALEHVIQKSDAGADVEFAGAVKVNRDGNFRFARLAFNRCFAHLQMTSECPAGRDTLSDT
jgi:hypothetical protein